MTAELALFNERLIQKDKELAELQTSYNKFRLKTKVKLDQLKQQITQYCNDHQTECSEEDNPALLRVRLVEAETALADSKLENERMADELVRRQMHINDHNILIRSLEDRLLKEISSNEKNISDRRRANQQLDLERIHQQMMYKDERIVEMNNIIMDKDRQIMDLMETCREHGEVANVKTQAMRIVQRKFEEIESKTKREVGTETDAYLSQGIQSNHWETHRSSRGTSPGRLVSARVPAGNHNGNHSPPPLDPMEGQTYKEAMYDISEAGPSSSFEDDVNGKRGRKRVTFDLPPSAASSSLTLNMPQINDDSELKDLMSENSKLHDLLKEKDIIIAQQKTEIDQVDDNMSRATRESKNATLKARAVAQARIRELEDKMAELNNTYAVQIEHLEGQVETMRATREWEVEQNGTLREQISEFKNKNYKLNEELDASEKTRRELETKSDETQALLDQLVEELSDAEAIVVHMEDQKISILDDVDRLKEAIEAQEQLIEVLEADIVIYEEHIGILRESLGASKVDHRSLIRSKAFETKLRALEQEKEQINRKSKEDRLRYKALAQKVKLLEEENEKLTAQICEREMGVSEDQEMIEACRQLEAKIQQSETQLATEKSKFETELENVRQEKESQLKQALDELKEYREREDAVKYQQTVIEQQNIVQASEEREELERQIEDFRYQLDEKCNLAETLQSQMDNLLGQNFELQEKIQEMTNSVNAYDILVERHRLVAREAVELRQENVKLEQEVASVIISHEEQRSRSNSVQHEYHSLRKALKEADVRNEEKDKHIEELIEKIRKLTSEEEAAVTEQSPVIDSQELQDLRIQLQEAREKMGTDKQEKKKLKLAVKKLLEEKSKTESVHSHSEEHVQRVTVAETQQAASPSGEERAVSEETDERIRNLEMECRLSGELNVEMGRAMLELEQQVDTDYLMISSLQGEIEKASTELKLKEMMYAEITSELELARAAEQEMQNRISLLEEETRSQDQLINAEHNTSDDKEHTIDELKSQFERLQKSFDESRNLNTEHAAQIGRLQADLYSKQEDLNSERVRVETESQRQNEQNMNELKEEIRLLESERETFIANSQGYQSEIEQLKMQLDSMLQQMEYGKTVEMNNNSQTEHLIQQLTADIQRLQGEQEKKMATIAGYESQITHLQNQLHQREQELHMERNSRMEAETNLANAHSSMQLLRSSFTDTTDRVAAAQRTESGQDLSLLQATVATVEAVVEQNSPRTREHQPTQETPIMPADSTLESENIILRNVVQQSQQMQDDVYQDVAKLLELKNELETAVDALKGEIWTLNGQLKASVLDRENLQDQVVELDTALSSEKTRADGLDRELSEQVELTEKATRQAAEAENESNRRLAECLDMESRREQLEKSYAQLTDYYNQLQAAYNMLYAQVNVVENKATTSEEAQQQSAESAAPVSNHEAELLIASILSDLQLNPASVGDSLQEKLNLIQTTIKDRLKEIEESRAALMEQRRVTEALEERLTSLEDETEMNGAEVLRTKERLLQVEGDLEWKEDECESLKRRVDELQAALDSIVTRDADEAARLATRQADVDSLFRTNAELAHTNVRLQNELDDSQQEQLELQRNQEESQNQDKNQQDTETEELKALLDEKTEELITVRAEVTSLSQAKKDLEDKIDTMEAEMCEKSEALETLQNKLRILQSSTDSRRSPQKSESPQPPERTESQNLVDRLQDEIFTLKKHLESVQTQLSTAVINLDAAEHTADAVRQELSSVKSELLTLSEHSQKESAADPESEWGWGEEEPKSSVQDEDTTSDLSKQLEKVQSAYQTLVAEHETLKTNNDELKKDNEKLAEINEDLKDVEEDLERYKELLKGAKATEAELKEQLEKQKETVFEKEPVAAQDDSDWGWGEQPEAKDEVSENKSLVTELTEKVASLQEQYNELLTKYDEMTVANSSLKAENQELTRNSELLVSLETELAQLKEQQEATLELQTQLQEQLECQKQAVLEREPAQQDESDWGWGEQKSKEKESNENMIQELTTKIELLEDELDELRAKYSKLDGICSYMKAENESLTEANQDLKDVEEDLKRYKELLKVAQEKEKELVTELEKREQAAAAMEPVIKEESAEAWNEDAGWDDDNWGTETKRTEEVAVPEEPTPNLSVALENLQSLYDDLSKDYSNLSTAHNQLTIERELLEGKIKKQEQLIEELEENEEKLRIAEERQKELEEAIARSQEQKETQQGKEEPASTWTDDNTWGEDNWGDDQEPERTENIEEQSASCSNEEYNRLTGEVAKYSELVERLEAQCQEALDQGQSSEEQVLKLRQQQQEVTSENERLQSEVAALESRYTTLTEELQTAQTVNSKLKTQLVDQDNSAKLEETLNELEAMREKLTVMKKRMMELEQQNELLKDSEARLLDSVDEFGEQAEKEAERANSLQKVVNELEEKLMKLEEKLEQKLAESQNEKTRLEGEIKRLENELEAKSKVTIAQPTTSISSESEMKRVSDENTRLSEGLNVLKEKLTAVEQERAKIKTAYDQLRARLVARRAAATASRDISRRSSIATENSEIPEEEPAPSAPVTVSVNCVEHPSSFGHVQAVDPNVSRRRSALPKK